MTTSAGRHSRLEDALAVVIRSSPVPQHGTVGSRPRPSHRHTVPDSTVVTLFYPRRAGRIAPHAERRTGAVPGLGAATVPQPVRMALALLEQAASPGSLREVSLEDASPHGTDGHGVRSRDAGSPGAEALAVIEAAEAVKAWVDFVAVQSTRRLHEVIRAEVMDGPDAADLSRTRREMLAADARGGTASEIEAATGLGLNECYERVRFALAPRAATNTMTSLMRQGDCSSYRARMVWQKAEELPADLIDQIARIVLAPRADGTQQSQSQFRRQLHRLFCRHQDQESVGERHGQSLRDRGAFGELEPDGTGSMRITGSGARVAAALARVDRLARRFRARGDCRPIAALRSDVALDLLLYGWVPPLPDGRATSTSARPITPAALEPVVTDSAAADSAVADSAVFDPAARDPMAAYRELGASPPATVDVVVTMATLLGLDDGVAEVRDHGFVGGELAREMAMARGSVWSRIVTDPLTGRAVERSLERYQPDEAMRTQSVVRDHVCRGPGCTVPATRSQLDHEQAWAAHGAGGPTSEPNLLSKHPRHHSLKTKGYWTSDLHDDGSLTWTTMVGRTYSTNPHDYRELDGTSADPHHGRHGLLHAGPGPSADRPSLSAGWFAARIASSDPRAQDLTASRELYDREASGRRHTGGVGDEELPLFVKRRPPYHRHARTADPEPPPPDPGPPPF